MRGVVMAGAFVLILCSPLVAQITISGTVSCEAWNGGYIYVMVCYWGYGGMAGSCVIDRPGPYTVEVDAGPGTRVEVEAFWDADADGRWSVGDWRGWYGGNPLTLQPGANLNVNLRLEHQVTRTISGTISCEGYSSGVVFITVWDWAGTYVLPFWWPGTGSYRVDASSIPAGTQIGVWAWWDADGSGWWGSTVGDRGGLVYPVLLQDGDNPGVNIELDRTVTATVSGTLDCLGYSGGWIRFVISDGPNPNSNVLSSFAIMPSPDGSYCFPVFDVPPGTRVWISAWWDADADAQISEGDWVASYRGNPVVLEESLEEVGFVLKPYAERIVFASRRDGNGEIYAMRPDGTGLINLSCNPAEELDPCFPTPDGSSIIFESWRDGNGEIYLMNANGSDQRNLTADPAEDYDPCFSPDGSRIAFTTNRDGNWEIYVMNADGSDPVNLTNHPAFDRVPSFSPDGSRIAFASNRDGNWEIYVMNADGSDPVRLTYDPAVDYYPTFSPDGRILFASTRDGNWEIYVMNADGSDPVNLTNHPSHDTFPACFSPDGSRIAFTTNRDGNWEIYVMNADGSDPVRLTYDPAEDRQPRWGGLLSPRGDYAGDVDVDGSDVARFADQYASGDPRADLNGDRQVNRQDLVLFVRAFGR